MPEPVDQESDRYDSPGEQMDRAETSDEEEPFVETRHKRVVRKPRWMRDYISEF